MSRFRIAAPVLAAAFASACGIPEDQYNKDIAALKGQIQGLEGKRTDLEQRNQKLESERDRCLAGLEALGTEKGQITGDLKAALDQLDQMREIAQRQKQVISSIVDSLKSMSSAGKLKVVQRQGKLIVEIAENILFASGASALKTEGRAAIAELAPILATVKREFQVTGHTDNVGTEQFNWKLSMDRAYSVLKQMTDSGYPADSISAAGYAWFQPVSENDTPEGRQLNRRVEIVLVPNLDELKLPLEDTGSTEERLDEVSRTCDAFRS